MPSTNAPAMRATDTSIAPAMKVTDPAMTSQTRGINHEAALAHATQPPPGERFGPPVAAGSLIASLRDQYPEVPFLALGQTVFWDEPTKAILRSLADRVYPDARLIAGVHDTDYFAKTAAHVSEDGLYVALAHDDGRTRDLWSAAGELSSLFGSESVPTRAVYRAHGVPFDWLAKTNPGGKAALYAEKTAAWGWRGIVHTGSHSIIAHDIHVRDIYPALTKQLAWGFAKSISCLHGDPARTTARHIADAIQGWIDAFMADCTADCRLSDLYQTLLPHFHELLLGAPPRNLEHTASTELFRFHTGTCERPLFGLLCLFLDPARRQIAKTAYNDAVAGSGIYTLDGFGDGAIPFDLVIPGKGRGTIRLVPRGLVVETQPDAILLDSDSPITTIRALAETVERHFGEGAALVGKAVTLADMIAAEHLVLFHETASGYTRLTRRFNLQLAAAGHPLNLHPIIRVSYPTWDALAAVSAETVFALPSHLARAFGAEMISAPEFARRWRVVVAEQRELLAQSKNLRGPRDVMRFLEGRDPRCWCQRLDHFETALQTLRGISSKADILRAREDDYRASLLTYQHERREIESRMGEDWRQHILPLRHAINEADVRGENTNPLRADLVRQLAQRASAYEAPLAECADIIRATKKLIASFRHERRLLQRGQEAAEARQSLRTLTREAQMARLDLVHDAFLTVDTLEHTQARPTAWWLPLVSPDGTWFRAIAEGTTGRLERLA